MPDEKKIEDKIDWKKEYDNKQKEAVALTETIADLRSNDAHRLVKEKLAELVEVAKELI